MVIEKRNDDLWADLFWGDLSDAAQSELLKLLGDNGNFDVFPLASVNVSPAEDEQTQGGEMAIVTIERKENNWVFGSYGRYKFEAKVYDVGSEYGINGGRVSKMSVWRKKKPGVYFTHETVLNYDRSWDVKPKKSDDIKAFETVHAFLENMPIEE
ncbi:hypothetical protein FACS1894132_02200 [Clostridia bacterium]|nr:hypothetical protein FACS1894132_02200 [Clostridia bacterium]